jgi:hypothetical protein
VRPAPVTAGVGSRQIADGGSWGEAMTETSPQPFATGSQRDKGRKEAPSTGGARVRSRALCVGLPARNDSQCPQVGQ